MGEKSIQLADMLEILNGDLRNEWKHLRFYLFHASAVTGLHATEYKEFFLEEAAGEMVHVTQFSDLITGLGGTATDKSNDFLKFKKPKEILEYAYEMEKEVVSNYSERIKHAQILGGVDGQWLEIFLETQIQKSREDVDHYKQIIQE